MRVGFLVLLLLLQSLHVAGSTTIFESGFEAGERAPGQAKTIGLGSNLETVIDFAAAYPFADFFKQSRPWVAASQTVFDTGRDGELDLDADGWVRSLPTCTADPQQFCIARTVLFSNPDTVYPAGDYTIRYDGEGTLAYFQNSQRLTPVSTSGQDIVTLTGRQIFQLDITATNPTNPLRNIRIHPPGIDADNPPRFHPDFVARLAPYRTLRFMDWMHANGDGFDFPFEPNTQENFADRPKPSDAHWSRKKGVPVEIMVALANETGTEPWFTLPQRVNDDYVRQFARIVRDQLAPGFEVYIEHSNEVWNNFPQRFDIEARAIETMLPSGCPADPQARQGVAGCPSNFDLRLNQHGLRTRLICDLFRDVFAEDSGRIICTLGAQAANAFTAAQAADCPLARDAGLIDTACLVAGDALAIAPYFANYTNGVLNEDEVVGWTLEQLFAELTEGGQLAQNEFTPCTENGNTFANRLDEQGRCTVSALEEIEFFITASKQVADERDMRLLAYEGGQHLVLVSAFSDDETEQARKDTITDLFVAANRDPRMQQIYVDYFGRWKRLGGELFAHFALSFPFGPSGSWGVLESLTQSPNPPKLLGIEQFNTENPCWWQGCGIDQPEPPPPACPQPVADGGFEATTDANTNPNWASTSTQFGSALCDTGIAACADDPNASGSVGPRGGTAWTWFGVDSGNEVASVSQTVTLPDDGPRHLNFFLRRGFVSDPFDATLEVRLGQTLLQTFNEPASAEAGYVARSIDLSAQPRGTPLLLEFRYANGGDGKSNFNLDDVSIDCAPVQR